VDTAERRRVRGRVLAGSGLFVLGFTAVYTVLVTLASTLGAQLLDHADTVQRVVGGVIVLMGLAFLGLVPGLQREFRVRRMPATGLAGAPLLGAVFALGWVPCTGPTLAAVLGLATVEGSVGRGALLAVAYCLGIGIPFVLFGLGFRRLLGAFAVVRRHSAWVTRVGGVMLIAVGLLLLTGFWNDLVIWIRALLPVGEIAL
jgi:cytochrome c-type biogenesis protein